MFALQAVLGEGVIEPTWVSSDGSASLYLGDCLSILPHLPKVDAVVADPPYGIVNDFGVNVAPNGTRTTSFAWDKADAVADAVADACKNASSAFVFCGFDTVQGVQAAIRAAGMTPKPYVWIKQCPPPPAPGNWWPSGFELAVYAYRSGAWFGDEDTCRRNVYYGDSLRASNPERHGLHPTQKPIHVMHKVIESIAAPGTTVLDPFMGSGTTGVAAVRLGRRFIGCEIEPKYFEIAKRRIQAEVDRFALLAPLEPKKPEPELFLEAVAS